MAKTVTPETSLKKLVKQSMSIMGWFIFPILQGLGAHRGISDFIAIKGGRVLFLEIKAPKGKQSDNQIEFERQIKEHGGNYQIIRNLEEVPGIRLK